MQTPIELITNDNNILEGIYLEGSRQKPAVMYIHGMFGNYYTPSFIEPLQTKFSENNFAYLATNNRGREDRSRYELLEEAHLDISAGIKFLAEKGYNTVILIGHSAGTLKVVRYLFEGEYKDKIIKLVLISPIDPLGGRIAHGRGNVEGFLLKAQQKINEGKGTEIITSDFDHDEVSYQTFVSWYQRSDFGKMFEFCDKNYSFPILKKIKIPVKIISGTKDEYLHPTNPSNPKEAVNILLNNIANSNATLIEGAGHNFKDYENQLVKEIMNFVNG